MKPIDLLAFLGLTALLTLFTGCMPGDLRLPLGVLPEGETQKATGAFIQRITLPIPASPDEPTNLYMQLGKALRSADDLDTSSPSCMIRVYEVKTSNSKIIQITLPQADTKLPTNRFAEVSITKIKEEFKLGMHFMMPTKSGVSVSVDVKANLYCLTGVGGIADDTNNVPMGDMLNSIGFVSEEFIKYFW